MLAGEDVFLCILKDELCIKDSTVRPFCTQILQLSSQKASGSFVLGADLAAEVSC